jgi:hypothetical protein
MGTGGQRFARQCIALYRTQVTEMRLEEVIYTALSFVSDLYRGKFPIGLWIKTEDMPTLKAISKEIILRSPGGTSALNASDRTHTESLRWFNMLTDAWGRELDEAEMIPSAQLIVSRVKASA